MTDAREPLAPPILVEDEDRLDALLDVLARTDEIAIDTEADSFYSYQERVCLIQVTAAGKDYLVDPLAKVDVARLGPILADPSKTKVFHDGEYDVLILKRDYAFDFAGLFDTRVAAAALGLELPGLASVLNEHFGVELDKSMQRSDWSRRPLTDQQIDYARLDTHYLLPLMEEMRSKLDETGRMQIVEGECRRLETLEPTPKHFDPDGFVRLKGARGLDHRQLQTLRELFVWRDGEAQRRDVPPFKVLGNKPLVEIARARVRSLRDLDRIDGFSPKLVRRLGGPVLEACRRAEELGPLKELPRLPAKDGTGSLDDAGHELHDRLKTWRRERAEREGFDASLVLNRHTLVGIAAERPSSIDELARVDGMAGWQHERFGSELLQLVAEFERDLAAGRIELGPRRRRRRK